MGILSELSKSESSEHKTLLPGMLEFVNFMTWFKATYPGLFVQYQRNFLPPLFPSEKVRITDEFYINKKDYHQLHQAVEFYYTAGFNVK